MPFVSTYQHLTMPVPCLRSMPGERETALLLVAHDSVRDYFWAVHAPFQVPDVMQIPWRLHPAAARKCCRARVSRPATLLPANTAAPKHRSRTRTQLHAHVRSTPPTHCPKGFCDYAAGKRCHVLCCTDPSMAHPGGNECANGVLAAHSRALAKGVVSVTPGALDSGKRVRRGRAHGAVSRRVGHPSRRRLQTCARPGRMRQSALCGSWAGTAGRR